MTHFASEGFEFTGGIGAEELECINGQTPTEGHIFRVISRPSFLPNERITYRQYSTCFLHNLEVYVENGWHDEGVEGNSEKECIDWINTRHDCSYEAVLRKNPTQCQKQSDLSPLYQFEKAYEESSNNARGKYRA